MECTRAFWGRLLVLPVLGGPFLMAGLGIYAPASPKASAAPTATVVPAAPENAAHLTDSSATDISAWFAKKPFADEKPANLPPAAATEVQKTVAPEAVVAPSAVQAPAASTGEGAPANPVASDSGAADSAFPAPAVPEADDVTIVPAKSAIGKDWPSKTRLFAAPKVDVEEKTVAPAEAANVQTPAEIQGPAQHTTEEKTAAPLSPSIQSSTEPGPPAAPQVEQKAVAPVEAANRQTTPEPRPAAPPMTEETTAAPVAPSVQSSTELPPLVAPKLEEKIFAPFAKEIVENPSIARELPVRAAARPVDLPAPAPLATPDRSQVEEARPAAASGAFGRASLPWDSSEVFSAEMNSVNREAHRYIERGIQLAERGAVYSAKSHFIQSLKLVARALDAYHGTSAHGEALAAGFRALEEAGDFVARGTRLEAELNMPVIIASHSTPVLHNETSVVTPLVARQRYYTYAQEQLAVAVGKQSVGSRGLFSLGKMQTLPFKGKALDPATAQSEAVVFYQAALAVNSSNAHAANELGVLVARLGRLQDARFMLQHSVRISPNPTTWRNLAVVHSELGQRDLAQRATQSAVAMGGGAQAKTLAPDLVWVKPEAFARANQSAGREAVAQIQPTVARPTPEPVKERKQAVAQARQMVAPATSVAQVPSTVASPTPAPVKERKNVAHWFDRLKTQRF